MEEHELPERLRGLGLKKFIPGVKVVIEVSEQQLKDFTPLAIVAMNAKERGA